jgi:septal ring factor EnvC (AmiA/AmiB activator)
MQLTAALQRLSRRPPALSLLQPGSVQDAMHLRAMLETMLPEIERRTAALRYEIDRSRALQQKAVLAANGLRASKSELAQRRQSLVALETRQRLASRTASGLADREVERSLALAEKARDLDALALELGRAGELREALARLPGPVMRPARPAEARVTATEAPAPTVAGPSNYVMPVAGRLLSGFGVAVPGAPMTRGVALAARAGAQAVAPAAGRVAFAGPYRGYGQIVIIEHAGGWTSLVTGLARLDARVGDTLVAGSPLGIAGTGSPIVTLELRHDGEPVNPLQFVG